MERIFERVMCKDCPILKKEIFCEGEKYGVEYVVVKSNEKYIICDNEEISWDDIMKHMREFEFMYVPKFGKFEIENFIGYFMKEALLITKDITNLFNMNILCDDSPFNVIRVNSDQIKEKLMECFEVVKIEKNITYLKFKWKRWDK